MISIDDLLVNKWIQLLTCFVSFFLFLSLYSLSFYCHLNEAKCILNMSWNIYHWYTQSIVNHVDDCLPPFINSEYMLELLCYSQSWQIFFPFILLLHEILAITNAREKKWDKEYGNEDKPRQKKWGRLNNICNGIDNEREKNKV